MKFTFRWPWWLAWLAPRLSEDELDALEQRSALTGKASLSKRWGNEFFNATTTTTVYDDEAGK